MAVRIVHRLGDGKIWDMDTICSYRKTLHFATVPTPPPQPRRRHSDNADKRAHNHLHIRRRYAPPALGAGKTHRAYTSGAR